MSSSWKDESSQTTRLAGAGLELVSGRPTFPAVGPPRIAPSSSVVVVFPFVPVTPTSSSAEQPVAELDLAPDRDPARPRDADEQLAAGHAGALDEHVDVVEQAGVAVVSERPVGPHDLHPAPLEQGGGALPGARHPEHEHALHGRK